MSETLHVLIQIAPIFLALIVGFILRRHFICDSTPWDAMNALCYWLLFPMLLFQAILGADLSFGNIFPYLAVIFLAFIFTFALVILLCNRLQFSLPVCNATVQGASRHNSFMALAICGAILNDEGFAIATLATAFQVVVTNFCVMGYISSYTQNPGGQIRWGKILSNQVRNPFLMSIGAALLLKQFGVHYIPLITETTALLGRSALPISLLATGAGLTLAFPRDKWLPMLIAVSAKMFLFPVLVLVFASLFVLSPAYFFVAIVYAAVPTAASSYVVARLTGGDAPLLSSITMLQVLISFFSFVAIIALFDFTP